MAFDLATAQPVQTPSSGFDLSTATPVDSKNAPSPATGTKWLPSSVGEFASDLGNNLVRAGAKAVAGLPLMAEDFGVAVRNLAAGKDKDGTYPYEMPSTSFNKALDAYTTAPDSKTGKVGEFLSSVLLGGRIPGPTSASQVPSNFVPSATVAQQTLGQARNAGYVVPPATTNPSMTNRVLESIGGKTGTAQDAAIANMPVTNKLVRSALGMGPDDAITPDALNRIRNIASNAYQNVITKAGDAPIKADEAYANGIKAVTDKFKGVANDFGPSLTNSKVLNVAEDLDKPQFSGTSAVDAMRLLRDNASTAFTQGDKQTGSAFRALSDNLESMLERHLSANGDDDALSQFKDARQLIAKTYSVEKALNPATGNVSAVKLGQQLAKGKPLSGPLQTAAQTGMAFPQATKEILDSGSVRNTDVILGGLASLAKHDPTYLIYPFARKGVRSGLLSDAGQTLGSPGSAAPTVGGMPAALAGQAGLLQ